MAESLSNGNSELSREDVRILAHVIDIGVDTAQAPPGLADKILAAASQQRSGPSGKARAQLLKSTEEQGR